MTKAKPEIQLTADGSNTLFVPSMDEHYHSVNGAKTEAMHIFIRMGLLECTASAPHILEIGFGTGLNAFLTLLEAEKCKKEIFYTGIELYPLAPDIVRKLDYPASVCPERAADYYALHSSPWQETVRLTSTFHLHKLEADFTSPTTFKGITGGFDLIYFDAFAPDKQAGVWTQEFFDFLFSKMNEGGALVTYCAKGVVRRMLQSSGFVVERLPGPPGKREMLRATKGTLIY